MSVENEEGEKNLCGSYLFKMPFLDDIDSESEWDDLVLLEKDPLFNSKTVVLYFPPNYNGPRNIALLQTESDDGEIEPTKRYLIKQFAYLSPSQYNTSRASFHVADYIQGGLQYEIVLTEHVETTPEGQEWTNELKSRVVASFSIDPNESSKRGANIAIVLILLLVITALMIVLGYMQYLRVKRNHKVDPKR
jgi:hypothetical protein